MRRDRPASTTAAVAAPAKGYSHASISTSASTMHVSALLNTCEMLVQRGYQILSVLDNARLMETITRIIRECQERTGWVRFAPLPLQAAFAFDGSLVPEVAAHAEGWTFEDRGPAIVAEVPHPSERVRFTSLHARSDLKGSEHLWVYFDHKSAAQADSIKARATSVSIENTRTLTNEILVAEQEDEEPRPHRILFLTAKGVTASAAEPLKDIGVEVESWKFTELVRNPSRHILWSHISAVDNYWDETIRVDLGKGVFVPGRGPLEPMTRLRVDPLDLPVIRIDDKVSRFYGLVEGSVVCRIAMAGFSQGFFQMRRVPMPYVDEHRRFLRARARKHQATEST